MTLRILASATGLEADGNAAILERREVSARLILEPPALAPDAGAA